MASPHGPEARTTHWTLLAGLGVWIVAVLWWLTYYGQWQGPFELLDRKFLCLVGDASECVNFRDFIGPNPAVPVYSNLAWYGGAVFVAIGLFMTFRKRS